MKLFVTCFLIVLCSGILNATLIHRYDFNNSFADNFAGPALIPVHTDTSTFDSRNWSWTSFSAPGGGLLLNTSMPNQNSYSLRIVFKYNSINTIWTKIISFAGYNDANHYFSSDNGLYFNHGNLYLYPYLNNTSYLFQTNTWYDLLLTRDALDMVNVYLNPVGQTRQLVLQYPDIYHSYIPSYYQGNYHWGLFYDDTTTTAEWTVGGSVALIELYDDALTLNNVQDVSLVTNGSQLTLSWTAHLDASSYNVYATDDPEHGTWELLANTINTSLEINPAYPRRFFYVKAVLD